MGENGKHFYEFGPFSLNVTQRLLLHEGKPVPLGAKAFQTLLTLLENRGRVVTREKLLRLVWPTTTIDQSSLNQQIRNVRLALGDDARAPASQFIQTVQGEGYSFIGDATERWENTGSPGPPLQNQIPEPLRASRFSPSWVILILTILVVGGLAAWFATGRLSSPPIQPPVRVGRVLVRSTSEGRSPARVALSHPTDSLALNPDGKKIFVTSATFPAAGRLSIVSIENQTVRTIPLPTDGGPLAVSPDRKLYIGSRVEGLMVLDITREQLRPGLIPTHGPVWKMALTPDGKKLFLAMGNFGVKRLRLRTGEIKQITSQVCPEYLELDPSGRRLYVSYQHSGPGGRSGHDSLEVFDAETEESLGIVSGPPIVGGNPSVSPDGRLVILDGLDACQSPVYDHVDCPLVPSHIYHLFRSSDRRILRSFPLPVTANGTAWFVDNSRFFVLGSSVTVADTSGGAIRERWEPGSGYYRGAVRAPDGRRIFIGSSVAAELQVLEIEDDGCSPPQMGLVHLYSGDGTMEDAANVTQLASHGRISFVPGRVGQAFFFDGVTGFLTSPRTSHYTFGTRDSTLGLYVKFASQRNEMVLVERMTADNTRGFGLIKSADNRLLFKVATANGPVTLMSRSRAIDNHWYHLTVTKTDQDFALFVNGELEIKRSLDSAPVIPSASDVLVQLHFGARERSQSPLHGWLDEVVFYDRALAADEVKRLYQLRETGPCRL
jgi:DNA-binding winged helix-turn-helix (wHTH) protein/DNA-binding beta-propeller fold protein YncE